MRYQRRPRSGRTLTVRISDALHSRLTIIAAINHNGNMNECYKEAFKTYVRLCADDIQKALEDEASDARLE